MVYYVVNLCASLNNKALTQIKTRTIRNSLLILVAINQQNTYTLICILQCMYISKQIFAK
jgi:hypothetical protein